MRNWLIRTLWMLGLATSLVFRPAEASEVRIAISKTPLASPLIVALEKGFFATEGLRVSPVFVDGGHRAAEALLAGKVDIATSTETVVMFQSFKQKNFGVFGTFVTNNNDCRILARVDSNIKTVADFAGQRVGTVKGSSSEFFLDQTLMLSQVPTSAVEIINVNPEDTILALAKGTVAAIATWEPWIYLAGKALGDQVIEIPHYRVYTTTFNLLVRNDFAKQRPEVLQAILRAVLRGNHFLEDEPSAAQRIVSERIGQNVSVVKALWGDLHFELSLHQWLLTTLEAEAQWAIGAGLVTTNAMPDFLETLILGPMEQVNPQAVTVFR